MLFVVSVGIGSVVGSSVMFAFRLGNGVAVELWDEDDAVRELMLSL